MEKESFLSCLRVRRNSPLNMNSQIKTGIKELIASNKLSPGAQVPSVNKLADICGVSFHTAKYAIRDLVSQGVLEARSGIGTFVPEKRPLTTEIFICENQPSSRSKRLAFHMQIIEGLVKGYGDPTRRLISVYTGGYALSTDEILTSARAKNADCIIAYSARTEEDLSLRKASHEISCISLGRIIPDSMAHSVIIDPEKPLRRMLEKRIRAGRQAFAFIGNVEYPKSKGHLNPYVRIHEVFCEVMDEAGIEPMVCWINGQLQDNSSKLSEFEKRLSDETTLIRLPYRAPAMAIENSAGLDIISYTESRQTLKLWENLKKSVLYGGLEKCGLEAARLHNALKNGEHENSPVRLDIEPDVFDLWDGEGFPNLSLDISAGIEEIV